MSIVLTKWVSILKSVNNKSHNSKCKLLDWCGSGEIIAEGHWFSNDSKELVHHVMLGPNVVRAWVHMVRKPKAFLWRPTSVMTTIEETISGNIA